MCYSKEIKILNKRKQTCNHLTPTDGSILPIIEQARRALRVTGGPKLPFIREEEGGCEEGDRSHDDREGRVSSIPASHQVFGVPSTRAKEARLPVHHKLLEDEAGRRDYGCKLVLSRREEQTKPHPSSACCAHNGMRESAFHQLVPSGVPQRGTRRPRAVRANDCSSLRAESL